MGEATRRPSEIGESRTRLARQRFEAGRMSPIPHKLRAPKKRRSALVWDFPNAPRPISPSREYRHREIPHQRAQRLRSGSKASCLTLFEPDPRPCRSWGCRPKPRRAEAARPHSFPPKSPPGTSPLPSPRGAGGDQLRSCANSITECLTAWGLCPQTPGVFRFGPRGICRAPMESAATGLAPRYGTEA